jgi:hypothetical protein
VTIREFFGKLFGKGPGKEYPWTGFVLPYEFGPDGNSVGPQTALRLKRLVKEHVAGNRNIPNVILAAGFAPLGIRTARQTRTFSEMMREWLVDEGTFLPEQIHKSPDSTVWTSIGESLEVIRMIEEMGLSRNILVVSTWNHIYPRMWITWHLLLLFRPGWHVDFATTKKCSVGWEHELLGTVKYVWKSLAVRRSRT